MKLNQVDDKLQEAGAAALAAVKAPDKKLHFIGGALVACAAVLLVWLAGRFGLWAACLAAGAAVGIGYELVQKRAGGGTPEILDALATASGAAAVAGLVAVITIFFF